MINNDELRIWFENLKKGKSNQSTIFLNTNQVINSVNNVFVIRDNEINVLHKGNKVYIKNNSLSKEDIFTDKFFHFIFQEPIIIINDEKDVKKFVDLLKNYNYQNDIDIKYFVVVKKDFEDLLKMEKNALINFLEDVHRYLRPYYPNLPKYDKVFIDLSIYILKENDILSANLANYLYKFAYLDFTSSSTKVGREVRKLLGIKSKTINHIRTTDIKLPKGKPFKGYDLKEDKYFEIKKKIAQKLLNLGDKKLDIDKIAEITELSIKIVKKLSRE